MLSVFSSLFDVRNYPHSAWAKIAWPYIACWVGQLLTHYSQQMNYKQLISYCDQYFWLFHLTTCSHLVPKTLSSICHVVSMSVTQVSSVSSKQGGLSVQNHVNSKNKIQTQERFKRIAIYWDKAQRAHFQGDPLYQSTQRHSFKQQLNSEQWDVELRHCHLYLLLVELYCFHVQCVEEYRHDHRTWKRCSSTKTRSVSYTHLTLPTKVNV